MVIIGKHSALGSLLFFESLNPAAAGWELGSTSAIRAQNHPRVDKDTCLFETHRVEPVDLFSPPAFNYVLIKRAMMIRESCTRQPLNARIQAFGGAARHSAAITQAKCQLAAEKGKTLFICGAKSLI